MNREAAIHTVLFSAVIVVTGVRMPRMNSIMERWVRTCRSESLDPGLSRWTAP